MLSAQEHIHEGISDVWVWVRSMFSWRYTRPGVVLGGGQRGSIRSDVGAGREGAEWVRYCTRPGVRVLGARGSGVDVGAGRALHASWVVLGGGPSLHTIVGPGRWAGGSGVDVRAWVQRAGC